MATLMGLLGAEIGGYLAAAAAFVVAVLGLVMKSRADGRAQERAKQDRAALDALRERAKVDDETQGLDDRELRRRLGEWVPKQ